MMFLWFVLFVLCMVVLLLVLVLVITHIHTFVVGNLTCPLLNSRFLYNTTI